MLMPYMIAMTVHGHGSQMMTGSFLPWIILYLFKIVKQVLLHASEILKSNQIPTAKLEAEILLCYVLNAISLKSLFLRTTLSRIQFLASILTALSGVYLGSVNVAKDLTK